MKAEEHLDELVATLIEAHRTNGLVAASSFATLSRSEAAYVQLQVSGAIGGQVKSAKIAIASDASAMVAAIPNSMVVQNGGKLPGPIRPNGKLEVELAVRLNRDLVSGSRVDVRGHVGELLTTVEIIGSRLDDRKAAGPWGAFADAMVTSGLVIGSPCLDPDGENPDGLPIFLAVDGREQLIQPAKHPFGGVLAPLQVFADKSAPGLQLLPAGCVVTTGALSTIPLLYHGLFEVRLGHCEPLQVRLGD